MDEHFSFLQISYMKKKFYNFGQWKQSYKTFLALINGFS